MVSLIGFLSTGFLVVAITMEILIGAVLWSPLYGDTHQNVLYCVPLDAQSPCLSTHVMIIKLSLLGVFVVGFLLELLNRCGSVVAVIQ